MKVQSWVFSLLTTSLVCPETQGASPGMSKSLADVLRQQSWQSWQSQQPRQFWQAWHSRQFWQPWHSWQFGNLRKVANLGSGGNLGNVGNLGNLRSLGDLGNLGNLGENFSRLEMRTNIVFNASSFGKYRVKKVAPIWAEDFAFHILNSPAQINKWKVYVAFKQVYWISKRTAAALTLVWKGTR